MRVIVDYVMNHTSDEYPWFIESRSSRDFSNKKQMVDVEPGRVVVSTAPAVESVVGPQGLLLPKQEAVIIVLDVCQGTDRYLPNRAHIGGPNWPR